MPMVTYGALLFYFVNIYLPLREGRSAKYYLHSTGGDAKPVVGAYRRHKVGLKIFGNCIVSHNA